MKKFILIASVLISIIFFISKISGEETSFVVATFFNIFEPATSSADFGNKRHHFNFTFVKPHFNEIHSNQFEQIDRTAKQQGQLRFLKYFNSMLRYTEVHCQFYNPISPLFITKRDLQVKYSSRKQKIECKKIQR